jgi:ATP-dependent exoDNAse (exonuclease V) alpha subunit
MTAHASQGQTLEAVIVDLCVGRESSPRTSYVALSRARPCEDILIYRPFPLETFARRQLLGPDLPL